MHNRRQLLKALTAVFVAGAAAPVAFARVPDINGKGQLTMTRILMVATSADRMTPGTEPTGVWLEELTTPYYAFRDAGAEVTLASIKGGAIPVDQRSVNADGENDASVERYLKDDALKAEVAGTPVFTTIDPAGYDALFLPGGHGTMFDYPGSDELARLVERFDREGKIVAAVCHGPAGLVSAKKADGTPFVGLDQAVPFLLETRLKELGGKHEGGPDFSPFALRDGNLVTGQNPASATRTAELVMEVLKDKVA
jgi:putative intracellular protease/amidase